MNRLPPTPSPSTVATYSNGTYGENSQPPLFAPPIQAATGCDTHSDVILLEPPTYSDIVDQIALAEGGAPPAYNEIVDQSALAEGDVPPAYNEIVDQSTLSKGGVEETSQTLTAFEEATESLNRTYQADRL